MTRTNFRPRLGLRVRNTGFCSGVPRGETGTISEVAGFRGPSVYCDPSRRMIFVDWDNGQQLGVFKWELEVVK